jgi:hypothetical protein
MFSPGLLQVVPFPPFALVLNVGLRLLMVCHEDCTWNWCDGEPTSDLLVEPTRISVDLFNNLFVFCLRHALEIIHCVSMCLQYCVCWNLQLGCVDRDVIMSVTSVDVPKPDITSADFEEVHFVVRCQCLSQHFVREPNHILMN